MPKIQDRKIVIINQAVNYLTVGFANAFHQKIETVALITGSIHIQGEQLNPAIQVSFVNKWAERPAWKKFYSYGLATLRIYWLLLTRYRNYEVFFVSLPPWGYLLSLILPHRCSMVIWDVYPDVFKITGMAERHFVYRIWARMNKKAFRKAYRIFTIGNRMADLLSAYTDRKRLIIQPIWSIFQKNEKIGKESNPFVIENNLQNKFIVQYSGNIGLTHKVEMMVGLAELMKDDDEILFQIIGRGPRVPQLKKLVKEKQLPNCQFLPFQSDEMFPFSLSATDIGVVILDELTSKGSVPSKSYNLMSYGIPSLYIASDDSELHHYAEVYGHAFCCNERELDRAKEYIVSLKKDPLTWEIMARKAEESSSFFRRENADRFVDAYLASYDI